MKVHTGDICYRGEDGKIARVEPIIEERDTSEEKQVDFLGEMFFRMWAEKELKGGDEEP